MKKLLLSAFLIAAAVGFAQEPQKPKKVPQDTTKQEVPVKITPQQTDIEPEKREKTPKKIEPKKEIPSKIPNKKVPKEK